MNGDAIGAILILLMIVGFISMVPIAIYQCHKESKIEDAKMKEAKEQADRELEVEMASPKSRIRFIDSGREEHVTKTVDPYITDNRFRLRQKVYYRVVKSSERAQDCLQAAYEKGYLTDDKGATFPTCNLHKAFVEAE